MFIGEVVLNIYKTAAGNQHSLLPLMLANSVAELKYLSVRVEVFAVVEGNMLGTQSTVQR